IWYVLVASDQYVLLSLNITRLFPHVLSLSPLAGEIGKILGERWKNMSDTEKAPYTKKAAAAKQRYEIEKAAASSGGGGSAAAGDDEDDDEEEEDDDDE